MVIDDRLMRIGSANLNNRSMGLDTELDVFVQVDPDDEDAMDAIRSYRRRSLSYLLDTEIDRISQAEQENGSLVAAIESLRGGEHTLHLFEHSAPDFVQNFPLDFELADPDHPLDDVDTQRVLQAIAKHTRLRDHLRRAANVVTGLVRRSAGAFGLIAAVGLVLSAWFLTPLRVIADQEQMTQLFTGLRDSPAGFIGVIAGFILLGSIGLPITVLVAATGAILQDWIALPVAMAGVMGASIAGYLLGRLPPKRLEERISHSRLDGVVRRLRGRGLISVAVIRNLPVAPYLVVNMALGLAGVGWRDYLVGTLIGMLPGVALLCLLGTTLGALLADPSPIRIVMLLGILVAMLALGWAAPRLRRRHHRRKDQNAQQSAQPGETV